MRTAFRWSDLDYLIKPDERYQRYQLTYITGLNLYP